MKTYLILAALLLAMFLTVNFTFAQNEIERYKLPKIIEGSNLYVWGTPGSYNSFSNDSVTHKSFSVNILAKFTKWRFTRKLDYSADIETGVLLRWNSNVQPGYENTYNSSAGYIRIKGGLSYYPVKEKLYGGFYVNSSSNFARSMKPYSNSDIYAYFGFGRLLNAGQTIYALNFGKVLQNEGVITNSLPPAVLKKLTVLLDKRNNSEFYSKYKDDADIEFFSQIEKLLLDEKVIPGPLSSRTTLKLFQALTNNAFIYYPRYKGFLVQAEIGSGSTNYEGGYGHNNTLRMVASGLYSIPIGLNTDLLFSCYAAFPINNERSGLLDYPLFHSPLILREMSDLYYPSVIPRIEGKDFKFFGGAKSLAYYSISPTIGISGYVNYSYGKTEDNENNFVINSAMSFRYNILSRMRLVSYIEFQRDQTRTTNFLSGLSIEYIVF